jgi:hypothetical protein
MASYSVPAIDGSFLPANPLKFCLKYKPPTIAIVYTFPDTPGKKFIHEFPVALKETSDLNEICGELMKKETLYLN